MEFFKSKPNIGLDIGTSSIKLVELLPLRNDKKKFRLVNFFFQRIDNKKEEALAKVVAELQIRNRFVNIAIGGESVIVRLINIPKMNQSELNESLKFEAEKYIPFNIEEVDIQAQILKEKTKDNKMQVLLAAVLKKDVEVLISLVTGAGLRPRIVDVESFALYNAYKVNHFSLNETCLLLNIGAKVTNINILEEGILSFSRDVFIGGKIFNRQLIKVLGLEQDEVETLKREPKGRKQEVFEALKPALFDLKNEIDSSISYFESQSEKKVSKMYLSGGSAYLSDLSSFFKENFEIEVNVWDPLDALEKSLSVNTEELDRMKAQFVVCLGLALRS